MLVHLDFLLQTERRVEIDPTSAPPKTVALALEQALAAVDAAGFDVLETDLTTRDIAELGLHVVKVIVPGLVPLTADHRFPALASPRFRDVPRRLGLADDGAFEFNPIPHPFP
jgi:ribosomal protein S12 methylthiotransferase accessory factor